MSRGRDLEQILSQYTTFVKPAFEEFCLPVSISSASDSSVLNVTISWIPYSSMTVT